MGSGDSRAIDCDVHPSIPGIAALLPYMSAHWREQIRLRGFDAIDLTSYPLANPLSARADWRGPDGKPAAMLADLRRHALDPLQTDIAICNVLCGAQVTFNADFAVAMCRAVNDWLAAEWLDADTSLRASIIAPLQDPDRAAEEIERCAGDPRFVQVLLPAMTDAPLGQRRYWPIYRAAERHGLTIGVHAGSMFRHPPSWSGWPSYFIEEYAANAQAFQGQLLSLVYEGAFQKFPGLRVVLLESGVSWLPSFLWRANMTWRSVRMEVPWIDRAPAEIIREHVRLTMQPLDLPPDAESLQALLDQIGSDDMLLFATDFPHWQYDGANALPSGFPARLRDRVLRDNALAFYPRLERVLA